MDAAEGLTVLRARQPAAEESLVLVVDDLQWPDEPSLRFPAYVARRVGGMPVVLRAALRPVLPGEASEALEATLADRPRLIEQGRRCGRPRPPGGRCGGRI